MRCLLLALVLCAGAISQVPVQDFRLTWTRTPRIERFDAGERRLVLIGGVDVQINDIRLRCDSLMAWLPRETPDPAASQAAPEDANQPRGQRVTEIYAEGTVLLFQGSEFTRADRVWLDLPHGTGVIVDAVRRMPAPLDRAAGAEPVELLLRAQELRVLGPDNLVALGVSLSTCTFGHPHWHIASGALDLAREKNAEGAPVVRVDVRDNELVWGGLVGLPLPDLSYETGSEYMLDRIESARLGHSDQFGLISRVVFGTSINHDGRRVARLHFPLEWFTARGVSAGVDAEYGSREHTFEGRVVSRVQHDGGVDQWYGAPPDSTRGRLSVWHRQRLNKSLRVDAEVNLFSDKGYYPTYFESSFKTEKPPENLLFVHQTFTDSWLTGLFSERFQGFDNTTAFGPKLRWDLLAKPVFEIAGRDALLSIATEISQVQPAPSLLSSASNVGLWRTDLEALLENPRELGPFTLTPFVGARWSTWSEDAAGSSASRAASISGLRLQVQAWRDFSELAELLGVEALRHNVQAGLSLRDVSGGDLDTATLIPVDAMEAQARDVTELELALRNTLTTIKTVRGQRTPVQWGDADLALAWYPDRDRSPYGSDFSALRFDVLLRPFTRLEFVADGEWDFDTGSGDLIHTALATQPSEELRFALGWRHFGSAPARPNLLAFDSYYLQADWRIEEKWMLAAQTAYEIRQSSGLRYALGLARIGHDAVLQGTVFADPLENDFGFTISILPRLGFRGTRRFGVGAAEPRFDLFETLR